MDDAQEPVFSHFGICVSDLERSLRFYCDALGFEKAESHEIGSEFARLMEFPDVDVTSQFIRRGPTAIELLAFREPAPFGPRERRAVNQLGLTHLSFRVRDVRRHGGPDGGARRRDRRSRAGRPSTSAGPPWSSSTAPTPTGSAWS